jgi:hypothetical protein
MSVLKMSMVQQELDGIPDGTINVMGFTYDWAQECPIDADSDGTIVSLLVP